MPRHIFLNFRLSNPRFSQGDPLPRTLLKNISLTMNLHIYINNYQYIYIYFSTHSLEHLLKCVWLDVGDVDGGPGLRHVPAQHRVEDWGAADQGVLVHAERPLLNVGVTTAYWE